MGAELRWLVHLWLPFLGLGQGQLCLAPHPSGCVPPQVLFALCSLLRHFPYAQQQFLKLGGLQVLRSLVQEKGTEVLAVRVVTLLYDLVTEKVSPRLPCLPLTVCVCFGPFDRGPSVSLSFVPSSSLVSALEQTHQL